MITFDDGFYNFTDAAAPLLEEFGFPATFYMSTYHCIHQRPILRLTISFLLWRARLKILDPSVFGSQKYPAALDDEGQREKHVAKLLKEARVLSNDRDAQQAWFGPLAASLGIDWENIVRGRILHLMTPEEATNVETATTCEPGLAKADYNPLLLPRNVDTMAQSEVMFESWLSGGAAEILSLKDSRLG